MKRILKYYLELLYLIRKNFRFYLRYYLHDRRKLYSALKSHGISSVKEAHKTQWKINNKTCYFFGKMRDGNKDVRVFVKVMGENFFDCFINEPLVFKYINDSPYLRSHCPALYDSFSVNDYYCLVYEAVDLKDITPEENITEEIENVLKEYTLSGIIHTDFASVNFGKANDTYMFFDYGTSLCHDSNNIRIRNGSKYNHVAFATKTALSLIPEPDYYYDDAIHCGLNDHEREDINFIVGKNNFYYVRLGTEIYKYKTKKKSQNSSVVLLEKQTD